MKIKEIGKIESQKELPEATKEIGYMGWKIFKNHVRIIVSTYGGIFDFKGEHKKTLQEVKDAVYEMTKKWKYSP